MIDGYYGNADKSDIDWIFKNGYYVLMNYPRDSIKALSSYIDSSKMWKEKHHEPEYLNSAMVIAVAQRFLLSGDKDGFINRCNELNGV